MQCEVERGRLKVKRQFKTIFQQFGHEVMMTYIMLVTLGMKQKMDIRHLEVNWTRICSSMMHKGKTGIEYDLK